MRNALTGILLIGALVLVGAAWSASLTSPGVREPAWVIRAAVTEPRMFIGHPTPTSISYRAGRKGTVVVTLLFSHTVICRYCSAPQPSALPRGRRVIATFDIRTHQPVGLGMYRR